MEMGTLRPTSIGKRPLRSLSDLIDRRLDAALRREALDRRPSGDDLHRQVEQLQSKVRSLEVLLDGSGRGMARMPGPSHFAKLEREITEMTGDANAARRNVHCAFRILIAMESLGVGRIAGGTMNICGKLATIPLLDAPNDDVLEIGTLYGLFAAALLRMLERAGRDPLLTVVDPLIGSQHQSGTTMAPDPSGTPVRESAVRTNLSLAGAAGTAARIQVGYSTDPDVRAAVSDRRYGVIVVDGDHSYDGVAADLVWVEKIAAPGGIVVLDDCGDPKWPGVQAALDDHLLGASRLTLLGLAASSAYLRAA
ncbi:MAG: hypothetical protein QOC66_2258 [Pseudonocardiales bacterium]|jgi:hypothetical protein|nr:hypothetical protein [Pseudonocardiales bacterium]